MPDVIATRRHPQIKRKEAIWKLIADSYAGGDVYSNGGHLFQYPKESKAGYAERLKRSVYFNHVQPLADMLAGFIYSRKPKRKIPANLDFLQTHASKKKSLDAFMQTVGIHSLLYTCGILVDSPSDAGEYLTEADRKTAKKNPYCCLYLPSRIRDFYCDSDGELEWILLDNSEIEAGNPETEAQTAMKYRLWTCTEIIDYSITVTNGNASSKVIQRKAHALGMVPFVFVNWRDVNEDYICETPFEDIALLDRQVYNCLSYLDEMLAAGTFKMLFYPYVEKNDLPQSVLDSGAAGLSIMPFNGAMQQAPFFDGHKLEDVEPFLSAIKMYMSEMFSKVGLDKDQERLYVQSGVAKDLEFQKCEALLRLGSEQLEQTEKRLFEIAAKWLNTSAESVEIEYSEDFQSDKIDDELARYYTLSMQPFERLRKASLKKIVSLALADLPEEERKAIIAEIDSAKTPTVKELTQTEQQARTA